LTDLAACIERGTSAVREDLAAVAEHAEQLRAIQDTLDPATGANATRRRRFSALAARLHASLAPIQQHMARTMKSFRPGLFAGGDDLDLPHDNLDLERAFRLPKGHERRIHGHAHAGIRIVQRGPSLLLVLDAHERHPEPFTHEDLAPWRDASASASQCECQRRRGIMRRARSAKKRSLLLADLERRYRAAVLVS
jgi:hypothetical protein